MWGTVRKQEQRRTSSVHLSANLSWTKSFVHLARSRSSPLPDTVHDTGYLIPLMDSHDHIFTLPGLAFRATSDFNACWSLMQLFLLYSQSRMSSFLLIFWSWMSSMMRWGKLLPYNKRIAGFADALVLRTMRRKVTEETLYLEVWPSSCWRIFPCNRKKNRTVA